MMARVGRALANPRVFACMALAVAACASEGSPEVQAELTRLEQDSLDGVVSVERALADPTYRSLGEGVHKVEAAIRKLGMLENDPTASDAQRFQAMVASARAFEFACTQRLTDHSLSMESGASCPE